MRDLPALAQQISPELAGDVEDPKAALVVAHVEGIAGHPDVVAPAVLGLVVRHLFGLGDIRYVDDMESAVRPPQPDDTPAFGGAGSGGEHLVADKDVFPRPPGGVGAPDESGTADRLDLAVE